MRERIEIGEIALRTQLLRIVDERSQPEENVEQALNEHWYIAKARREDSGDQSDPRNGKDREKQADRPQQDTDVRADREDDRNYDVDNEIVRQNNNIAPNDLHDEGHQWPANLHEMRTRAD